MEALSATDAARRFAEVLDAVERGQSFLVVRDGRPVARIGPAAETKGKAVKALLRGGPVDPDWAAETRWMRSALRIDDRPASTSP
jgi:prevent-host-death family protein